MNFVLLESGIRMQESRHLALSDSTKKSNHLLVSCRLSWVLVLQSKKQKNNI